MYLSVLLFAGTFLLSLLGTRFWCRYVFSWRIAVMYQSVRDGATQGYRCVHRLWQVCRDLSVRCCRGGFHDSHGRLHVLSIVWWHLPGTCGQVRDAMEPRWARTACCIVGTTAHHITQGAVGGFGCRCSRGGAAIGGRDSAVRGSTTANPPARQRARRGFSRPVHPLRGVFQSLSRAGATSGRSGIRFCIAMDTGGASGARWLPSGLQLLHTGLSDRGH